MRWAFDRETTEICVGEWAPPLGEVTNSFLTPPVERQRVHEERVVSARAVGRRTCRCAGRSALRSADPVWPASKVQPRNIAVEGRKLVDGFAEASTSRSTARSYARPAARYWSSRRNGEPGRNRTFNQQIKSLLLCQLSYGPRGERRCGAPSTLAGRARLAPRRDWQTQTIASPFRCRNADVLVASHG